MTTVCFTARPLTALNPLPLPSNYSLRPDTYLLSWAEAPIKIARMTLTIKLDGNWSSFQLANSAPPLSVTGSAIAPSASMLARQPLQAETPTQNLFDGCRMDPSELQKMGGVLI